MLNDPRNREPDNVLGGATDSGRSSDGEPHPRDWERELENIIGGAAESVFESSDEEIAAELRSWGEDPDAVAEEVRNILLDAVDRYERSGRPVRVRKRASSGPSDGRMPC